MFIKLYSYVPFYKKIVLSTKMNSNYNHTKMEELP